MIRLVLAIATAFMMSFGAMAAQTVGQPCAISANLPQGIPTTEEVHAAALKCDIINAQSLVLKADELYNANNDPMLRVIDTSSPSGYAYIYDVMPISSGLQMDVRIVSEDDTPAPVCRLRKTLAQFDADAISNAVSTLAVGTEPFYAPREKVFNNIDGSHRVELLLDAKDVLTSLSIDGTTRHYSRHDQSNDRVTALNDRITEIANRSDGWVCN